MRTAKAPPLQADRLGLSRGRGWGDNFNYGVSGGLLSGLSAGRSRTPIDLSQPSTHSVRLSEADVSVVKLTPAQIQRSISPDALMSFEDGRSYKTLRPHLARLGLTPEAYREKWGLPPNYPMVAQTYSDQRSARARKRGFGQKDGGDSSGFVGASDE